MCLHNGIFSLAAACDPKYGHVQLQFLHNAKVLCFRLGVSPISLSKIDWLRNTPTSCRHDLQGVHMHAA